MDSYFWLDTCPDPGNFGSWGSGPTVKKIMFFVFFSPQLILQFYSGLSMVYFKENYNFTRFQKGSTFSRGVHHFSGGPTFSRGGGGGGGGV